MLLKVNFNNYGSVPQVYTSIYHEFLGEEYCLEHFVFMGWLIVDFYFFYSLFIQRDS